MNTVIKEHKISEATLAKSGEWVRIWERKFSHGTCYTVAINNCIQANHITMADAEAHFSRLVGK
jgi:hypothetical protein